MKNYTMRDILLDEIYNRMRIDDNIFFLTADFGSPRLDLIRNDPKTNSRYINVGIAEANLVDIATGQSLEGFTVYAYAIAGFLSMRAYEQIRNNLSILSQLKKELNVNLIGVGVGLSYDISGPSHCCLEDISIMRTLPNIEIYSPSDNILVKKFVDYTINVTKPKYIRLDAKPLPNIYENRENDIDLKLGFYELKKGDKICIISTGFMTHTAIKVVNILEEYKIGIVDIFLLPLNEDLLFEKIKDYKTVITISEEFINKGGLDSLISSILDKKNSNIKLIRIGFEDKYIFDIGSRDYLHKLKKLDIDSIVSIINDIEKENLKIK